jgi:hypothetical protein
VPWESHRLQPWEEVNDGRLTAVRDVTGENTGEWLPAADVLPETNDRLADTEARRLDALLEALVTELDTIEDDDQAQATRESIHRVQAYLDRREERD